MCGGDYRWVVVVVVVADGIGRRWWYLWLQVCGGAGCAEVLNILLHSNKTDMYI